MSIKLSKIASFLNDTVIGNDTRVNNIVIDSRQVESGDLFVAIPGKNFDGHSFIPESIKRGASAILCNSSFNTENITIPYIKYQDTLEALGQIALAYKRSLGSPFTIGITGTNGKTTVTKLTAEILKQSFNVSTTIGNYNNDIGLPLSILKNLSSDICDRCVYELGASKKNDISRLTNICEPNLTTLLNVSEAHMESFGDFDSLIKTKEEIFTHPKTSQIILNIDSEYYNKWKSINSSKKITTISISNDADYCIKSSNDEHYLISTVEGELKLGKQDTFGILPINLLFSISLAMEAGATIKDIKNGIKKFKGVEGRFYKYVLPNKATLIDDTYNANPQSMKSSLRQLSMFKKDKIFVMGDMGELGDSSYSHHSLIFKYAKELGINSLLYMGKFEDEAKSVFGENCNTFDDIILMTDHIRKLSNENTVVLVKASRFMNFDLIIKGLR